MAEENIAAAAEAADEFDSAFSEFAEARDGGNDEAPIEEPPQAEEPAAKTEEKAAEEAPAQAEAPKADAPKEETNWEHKYKSEVGRQAALQRQLAEAKQQLESVKKQTPETKTQAQATEQMRRLMEDFPEIADAVRAELEALSGSLRDEFKQSLQPIVQDREQQEVAKGEQTVKEFYPDYVNTVNTPEFNDWFKRQPAPVQALARSNAAGDAIALLDYYTGGNRSAASNTDPATNVREIRERRQQALERNTTVKGTGTTPVNDGPDSFEEAFDHFARRAERKAVVR